MNREKHYFAHPYTRSGPSASAHTPIYSTINDTTLP